VAPPRPFTEATANRGGRTTSGAGSHPREKE
jgi:hypothetical protein